LRLDAGRASRKARLPAFRFSLNAFRGLRETGVRRKRSKMNGIPVLTASGDCIARAWENSLVKLHEAGCDIRTQYDRPGDPPSKDATMIVTVEQPLKEPMIHRDLPGGFEDLEEYVMEVCEGIKDHCVRDPDNRNDTRWEYTYHQRLFAYTVPDVGEPIDQIEAMCRQLAEVGYTRRAQAVTWKVWEDAACYDPACLQSLWCRITEEHGGPLLSMNVRFRSNDAYKAALMNMFALVQLQQRIAARVTELGGTEVRLGRYCHVADSYHVYGCNMKEFKARFLRALETRTFEQRTIRHADVKDMMEEARPAILAKAQSMGARRN
jgi:thymidylate synthase